ncbi:MAG: hypothetical protein GEV08_13475 [Acidimicrobiia bacterium]|nr:hypothetical protein [Acidimicrobiia bacterium]
MRQRAAACRPLEDRTTVAAYCRDWCDTIAPQTTRDTSAAHYRWLLDRYVLPYLGHLRLEDLTRRAGRRTAAEAPELRILR